MSSLKGEIRLTFPRKLSYLHFAADISRKVCQMVKDSCDDPKFAHDVELCVIEACTNAIKHGWSSEEEDVISLYFQTFPDKLVIKVQDKGTGFKLESRPEPDIAALSDRGYGLYIIQNKMDKVEYNQTAKGNFLTMTKFFKREDKG